MLSAYHVWKKLRKLTAKHIPSKASIVHIFHPWKLRTYDEGINTHFNLLSSLKVIENKAHSFSPNYKQEDWPEPKD